MRSKVSNLIVVVFFVLFSGCYLSHEVSHSTEVDSGISSAVGGNPSAVGGGFSAVGGSISVADDNPSVDIDRPITDAGVEEASLLGAWQGRAVFVDTNEEVYTLDGIAFEFTDTEVSISFAGVDLGRAEYSINKSLEPYKLDINVEAMISDLAPQMTGVDAESIASWLPLSSSIFKIENNELTIATSMWSSKQPLSFDAGWEKGNTMVFELSSVR